LNPPGAEAVTIERFGSRYRLGDKVMQIVNDYEKDAFNGDLGFITGIDAEADEVVIDFDGREVSYRVGELDEIAPAYAVSIHKSQGSEYPAVVIPVMMQHYMMLERNLLYTGITRGKRLVVLVGQKRAIGMAVRGVKDRTRWSKLQERLLRWVNAVTAVADAG
jgi:exodeoxyribonuclease V alpha subunit